LEIVHATLHPIGAKSIAVRVEGEINNGFCSAGLRNNTVQMMLYAPEFGNNVFSSIFVASVLGKSRFYITSFSAVPRRL
jgi:hypothetical protein